MGLNNFGAIPDRNNGDFVNYSWFNLLKQAGVSAEGFLGGSSTTVPYQPSRMTSAQRDALVGVLDGAIIFNTTLNKLQQYYNGVWSLIGSGSGSGGGLDWIANPDFETDASSWNAYKDAAGVMPVDGTGGAPTTTIVRSASSPLAGTASGLITVPASNAQGEGVSTDFSIDPLYQSTPHKISIGYKASANFVPGDSSDIRVWIYDKTNGTLIQPAGYTLQGIAGSAWIFEGEFQTASNSTAYRLILHIATTNAAGYTVQIDNVSVGPSTVVQGSGKTDWVAYPPTLTGFPGASGVVAYSRRNGDSLEVTGYFVNGATNGSTAAISVGYNGVNGNVTVDTSKVPPGSVVGIAGQDAQATTYFGAYVIAPASDQSYVNLSAQTSTQNILSTRVGNDFGGTALTFAFAVPIKGWSSSVVMSSDADTRVVAAQLALASNYTPAVNGVIKYDTVLDDTHGAYNSSTGLYTVQVPGRYRVSVTGLAASGTPLLNVYINGTVDRALTHIDPAASVHSGSQTFNLKVGDTLGIYSDTSTAFSGSAGGNDFLNSVSIERISGPAQIAASETIAVIAGGAPQSTYTADTPIVYPTKIKDTHNAYDASTGIFTAPAPGLYRIAASSITNIANNSSSYVDVNNVHIDHGFLSVSLAGGALPSGTCMVSLIAGDIVDVRASANWSSSQSPGSFLNIERVGL